MSDTSESNELVIAGKPITAVALFSDRQTIDASLADLKKRATEALGNADISTEAGRKKIASVAYSVAKSKVAMVKMGKELTEEWRKRTKSVNEECNRIEIEADRIKDEIRKPLTDWENADKARVDAHEAAILEIQNTASFLILPTRAGNARDRLAYMEELHADRDWQEFAVRANYARIQARETLTAIIADFEKRQAEQAELERLRAEAEAARIAEETRLRHERDKAIAREAAERAQRQAEEKAAAEAERARLAAEAEKKRIEDEKQAAIDRAEAAERDRIASEERAERAQRAAQEKAAREREAAIAAERQRQEREAQAQRDAAAERERNKRHAAKINNEAKADLMQFSGLTDDQAIAVVTAIAKKMIRHTGITY